MDNEPHKSDQEEREKNKLDKEQRKEEKSEDSQSEFITNDLVLVYDDETGENPSYLEINETLQIRSNYFTFSRPSDPRIFNSRRKEAKDQKQKLKFVYPPLFQGPNRWLSIGPRNINGRVKCIAIHPSNPEIVYAGAASGGLWRTMDGGRNWEPFWDDNFPPAVGAIDLKELAPGDPNSDLEILVGTGEAVGGVVSSQSSSTGAAIPLSKLFHNFPGEGIYRYYFDGTDWRWEEILFPSMTTTRLGSSPQKTRHYTISKVHFADSTNVNYDFYVAGPDGFFGIGKTPARDWDRLVSGQISDSIQDPNLGQNVIYVCRDGTAGRFGGLFKTSDGQTFFLLTLAPNIGPDLVWPKIAILKNPNSTSSLIFLKDGANLYAFWDNSSPLSLTLIFSGFSGAYGWCSCLAVEPKTMGDPSPEVRILAGSEILRKLKGDLLTSLGSSVSSIDVNTVHVDQQMVVYSPSNSSIIYLANDGGVYTSKTSGNNWKKVSYGLKVTQFYAIGNWQRYGTVIAGGTQDRGTIATQGGLTWETVDDETDGGYALFDHDNPDHLFVERAMRNPVRLENSGLSKVVEPIADFNLFIHSLCPEVPSDFTFFAPWLRVLVQEPNNGSGFSQYFTGGRRIYRYNFTHFNWSPISQSLTSLGFISAIAFSETTVPIAYAGTGDLGDRITEAGTSLPAENARVYKFDTATTVNCVSVWTEILESELTLTQPVTDIVVHPDDSEVIYISLGWNYDETSIPDGFVYKRHRTSTGFEWRNITDLLTSGFPKSSANALAIDNGVSPPILYVGTDVGVFSSAIALNQTNHTWQIAALDLPNTIVTDLRVDERTRSLFASTFGRGLYRMYLDGIDEERVYLRTNALDTGEDMQIPFFPFEPLKKSNSLKFWLSPDIKILNTWTYRLLLWKLGGSIDKLDGVEFDKLTDAVIKPRRSYYILVQAHNRGYDTAENVKVSLFEQLGPGSLPPNYSAFTYPSGNANWQLVGPPEDVLDLEANKPKIVAWKWKAPKLLFPFTWNSYGFFAIIKSDNDPYTNPRRIASKLAIEDRKAALKKFAYRRMPFYREKRLAHFYPFWIRNPEEFHRGLDLDFKLENYLKGTIGLFTPETLHAKILEKNPHLSLLKLNSNDFEKKWLPDLGVDSLLKLDERLAVIDTSKIILFPNSPQTRIKSINIESGKEYPLIFWGDRKTRKVNRLEIIEIEKDEIVDGITFNFPNRNVRLGENSSSIRLQIILDGIYVRSGRPFLIPALGYFKLKTSLINDSNNSFGCLRKRLKFYVNRKNKPKWNQKMVKLPVEKALVYEGLLENIENQIRIEWELNFKIWRFKIKKYQSFSFTLEGNSSDFIGLYNSDPEDDWPNDQQDWMPIFRIEKIDR